MLNLSMKERRTAEEEILQRFSGSNELKNSLLPSKVTPLLYYQRKEKISFVSIFTLLYHILSASEVWTDLDFDNKTQGICMKV